MGIKVYRLRTRELVTGCGPDTPEADLHKQLIRADGSCQLYGDGGRAVRPDSNRTAEGNYWWFPAGELQEDRAGRHASTLPPALTLLMQGWLYMKGTGAALPPKMQPLLVRVLCLQPQPRLSMLENST